MSANVNLLNEDLAGGVDGIAAHQPRTSPPLAARRAMPVVADLGGGRLFGDPHLDRHRLVVHREGHGDVETVDLEPELEHPLAVDVVAGVHHLAGREPLLEPAGPDVQQVVQVEQAHLVATLHLDGHALELGQRAGGGRVGRVVDRHERCLLVPEQVREPGVEIFERKQERVHGPLG